MPRPTLSPGAYRRITLAALLSLAGIVVTGAAVRLTGSGLGCSDWPTCEQGTLVAPLEYHAMVEFVNRLVTGVVSVAVILAVLGSLVRRPRRRDLTLLSLGLVAGVIGQIVLGGITVLTDLHPASVQGHFVLSMVILWNAVVLHHRAGQPDGVPRRVVSAGSERLARAVAVAAAAVIVAGTVVTGTGPHGGDEEARRFGFEIGDVARIHGLTAAATVLAVLALYRRVLARPAEREVLEPPLRAVVGVLGVQAGIGYAQYAAGVPAWMVGLHVVGAVLTLVAVLHLPLSCRRHVPAGAAEEWSATAAAIGSQAASGTRLTVPRSLTPETPAT